ncbi:FCD domain-containing protein [Nonomuraea sp. NPDC050680]|uniref:FCD domain-containing protein n=1 Tax=Nonomuraea sp. NPDC050680 TaxID=3154630 RepID=UPI0033D922D1
MRMAVHGRFGDLESFLAADILFHRTLLEASGNDMLVALTTVHAEVAQAVQAGDPTHAQRATRNAQRATRNARHRRRGDEATSAMLGQDV